MERYSAVSFIKAGILYLLVLICLGASGCAGVGTTVPQERKIPLVETENSQGNFSYGSLTLEYSYSLAGNNMMLTGNASYQGGFDSLDIRILFLDAAGTVLQQELIYSSGYRTGRGRVSDRALIHDRIRRYKVPHRTRKEPGRQIKWLPKIERFVGSLKLYPGTGPEGVNIIKFT